jgi:hypothetical protein
MAKKPGSEIPTCVESLIRKLLFAYVSRRQMIRGSLIGLGGLTAGVGRLQSQESFAEGASKNQPEIADPIDGDDPPTTIAPSSFPLRFSEVVNFRGYLTSPPPPNFGPGVLANPKGIAYHAGIDHILTTVTPDNVGGRSLIILAVQPDGTVTRFAPGYSPYRSVESMLVVVPPAGPPVNAGFIAGEVYVNRGPVGEISRLGAAGNVLADLWVNLPIVSPPSEGLWGGLAFDQTGTFGGQLVAADTVGKIFLIDSSAHVTQLVDLAARMTMQMRLEGIAVAPSAFGPLGGQIIVGVEGTGDSDPQSGKIYAIDGNGAPTLVADIGFSAENVAFVPTNGGTLYHTQLSFERERENKLLTASASQFLARAGRMIVTNEMSGDLWEVTWDGSRYTQSLAGRAPDRWTSEGLGLQRTELEHAVFAVRAPSLPLWTDWSAVPGGGTTDVKPNAGVDYSGNLHLFVKGINDRRIYMQSMWGGTEAWTGWVEVPPGGQTTNHSLSSVLHDNDLHLFAVRDDGHIIHKRVFIRDSPPTNGPWVEVPSGFVTNAAVSAAVATGRLVLCAKGTDNQLYINELACGGRSWSGWSLVPGSGHTNVNPTVVNFQDELYLLIKGFTSDRILAMVRSADGSTWSEWAELPGAGRTDAGMASISANGQCHVAVKGLNNAPWINIASNTGTWSGWSQLPNPGTTDVALAATAIGSRVYLFAKGINDRQLYVRRTA